MWRRKVGEGHGESARVEAKGWEKTASGWPVRKQRQSHPQFWSQLLENSWQWQTGGPVFVLYLFIKHMMVTFTLSEPKLSLQVLGQSWFFNIDFIIIKILFWYWISQCHFNFASDKCPSPYLIHTRWWLANIPMYELIRPLQQPNSPSSILWYHKLTHRRIKSLPNFMLIENLTCSTWSWTQAVFFAQSIIRVQGNTQRHYGELCENWLMFINKIYLNNYYCWNWDHRMANTGGCRDQQC